MKRIGIEDLVRWAVMEEWPKVGRAETEYRKDGVGNGWGATASYVQLLTVIDWNDYGVLPDLAAQSDPHVDALVVAEVAKALDGAVLGDLDPDWLIGDLIWSIAEHQGDEAAGRALALARRSAVSAIEAVTVVDRCGGRRPRDPVVRILVERVVLARRHAASAAGCRIEALCRANGTAVWRRRMRCVVDYDAETGEPLSYGSVEVDAPLVNGRRPRDAYPVEVLVPVSDGVTVSDLVVDRARHVVWVALLRGIADGVADRLVDHRLDGEDVVSLPWMSGRRAGRILPDLSAVISGEESRGRRRSEKNIRRKA